MLHICIFEVDNAKLKELHALMGYFAPPPPVRLKIKIITNFFLLVYKTKIKFETFDGEINIKHKQISDISLF